MTVWFGIKVLLEVAVILLIAYGIMNEEKLVAFEDELIPVIKFCFHKYVLKDLKKKETKHSVNNIKKVDFTKKSTKRERTHVA